ncbi:MULTISPECIES: SDR family NAD(P)-dependent oxidoreductase [Nocardioides]|uniref:SDR family NAD(P)-dependent oxidoreductase n=1 Tax=Nocardioides TaxID=1839 RepID=UPI0018DF7C02|nr:MULTISPECIES: SDR family NAD(P)-dependent oxidoreductase [unclassified Nocardioides]
MTINSTLEGRTVLITGANRGLGQALVQQALDREAAFVYAAARTPAEHADDRVLPLRLDLSDPDSIETAARSVPTLDVLVNNAGVGSVGEDLSDTRLLAEHLQVNVVGPMALTNRLVPMLAKTRGRVVNVGSLAALANLPVMPSYSISKAAAMSLAQSQRALLARHGIRVHLVLSGPLDTDMSRALAIPKAAPEDVAAAILDGVARGDDEIFPDPMSAPLAAAWPEGLTKTLERANAALLEPADYRVAFVVARPADEVYAAVNDPRAWWDGEITGSTDALDAEFTYRYREHHRSVQRVAELVPGRRVAWEVVSSELDFVDEPEPWTGTRIVFEIELAEDGTRVTLTHRGLVPLRECYAACSAGWDHVAGRSLRHYLETGRGLPF